METGDIRRNRYDSKVLENFTVPKRGIAPVQEVGNAAGTEQSQSIANSRSATWIRLPLPGLPKSGPVQERPDGIFKDLVGLGADDHVTNNGRPNCFAKDERRGAADSDGPPL